MTQGHWNNHNLLAQKRVVDSNKLGIKNYLRPLWLHSQCILQLSALRTVTKTLNSPCILLIVYPPQSRLQSSRDFWSLYLAEQRRRSLDMVNKTTRHFLTYQAGLRNKVWQLLAISIELRNKLLISTWRCTWNIMRFLIRMIKFIYWCFKNWGLWMRRVICLRTRIVTAAKHMLAVSKFCSNSWIRRWWQVRRVIENWGIPIFITW